MSKVDTDMTIKLEITQDKLVDLLMNAATRDNISVSKKERKDEIRVFRQEFSTNIARLDNNIVRLDNKIDKVIWGIITSILVPVILRIFHI